LFLLNPKTQRLVTLSYFTHYLQPLKASILPRKRMFKEHSTKNLEVTRKSSHTSLIFKYKGAPMARRRKQNIPLLKPHTHTYSPSLHNLGLYIPQYYSPELKQWLQRLHFKNLHKSPRKLKYFIKRSLYNKTKPTSYKKSLWHHLNQLTTSNILHPRYRSLLKSTR